MMSRPAIGIGLIVLSIPVGLLAYMTMMTTDGKIHPDSICISVPVLTLSMGIGLVLYKNDRLPEPSLKSTAPMLTLILILTILLLDRDWIDPGYQGSTPTATLAVDKADGNLTIHVADIDCAVVFSHVQYQLLDPENRVILSGKIGSLPGELNESNFLAVENFGSLNREKLSSGDMIHITSSEHGGPAGPGSMFRLYFVESGKMIAEVKLP